MTIPDHRMSDEFIDAAYISPEDEGRLSFLHDIESGPIGYTDTTGGMNYQPWTLTYETNIIRLTPRNVGSPVDVFTLPGVVQASFCFDQNARPSVVYQDGTGVHHYWYDTDAADFVTTDYPAAVGCLLSLDDKRRRQVSVNDIIFWYTEEFAPNVYHLYTREQRDRFTVPYQMLANGVPLEVPPYIWKGGMHRGLRGKVTFTYQVPQ